MPLRRPHEYLKEISLLAQTSRKHVWVAGRLQIALDIVQLTPLSMPTSLVNAPCVVESRSLTNRFSSVKERYA